MTGSGRPIEEGMRVLGADGRPLGRVIRTAEQAFEVEHGFFFPRDGMVDESEAVAVDQQGVHLRATRREMLREWKLEEQLGDALLPERKALPHEEEGLLPMRLEVAEEPGRFEEPPGEPPLPPDAIDFGEDRESLDIHFGDAEDAGLDDDDPFGPAPSSDGDRYRF